VVLPCEPDDDAVPELEPPVTPEPELDDDELPEPEPAPLPELDEPPLEPELEPELDPDPPPSTSIGFHWLPLSVSR
jgi:hypothetical protein